MKTLPVVFFIFCVSIFTLSAKTWQVGSTRTYTVPSQVSGLVHDGDTVAIDSGLYSGDVAHWTANDLVITCVNGMARLWSGGNVYGGKAIWVIGGNNTLVENIEFAQAACPDNNGAGIREEGTNLHVSHCYFHDNQEGILAGDNAASTILIEYTEFSHNGAGDGYSHNLYINHVQDLIFRYNYSHGAVVGHELKSRALHNEILYNRFSDEATGTASRDIDLPNGGWTVILGNVIEQGPNTQNSNIMEYGLEGLINPDSELYVVNNTFVNDRTNGGTFIQVQNGTTLGKAYNNIFAGNGTVFTGTAQTLDTSHNIAISITGAGFSDAANYDYHLVTGSPAIDNATLAGAADTFALIPVYEYVHPANKTTRTGTEKPDIGAFGFGNSSGINTYPVENKSINVFPNPSAGIFNITIPDHSQIHDIHICNLQGQTVLPRIISCASNEIRIDVSNSPTGIYFIQTKLNNNLVTSRLVVMR